MSRLGYAAYAAGIVGVTLVCARETLEPAVYLYQGYDGDLPPLAIAGWALATFGPIALSASTWLLFSRNEALWFLHLLFIPLSIAAFWAGNAAVREAVGAVSDSMLYSMPFFAAFGYLALSLLVHTIGLITYGLIRLTRATSAG